MSARLLSGSFLGGPGSTPFAVAHRGAPEAAPENTLPAFEAALTAGVRVLECDVRLSRDRQVVVFHDAQLMRITGVEGLVREWRWRDLARLSAADPQRFGGAFRGTRIPLLQDLLELARGRAELMIEIKSDEVGPDREGIERRCLELAARVGMREVGFISMAPTALERIRHMAPGCTTGLVLRRHDDRRAVARAGNALVDFLIAHVRTLLGKPQLCASALAAGLSLGAYPVNSDTDVMSLVAAGVTSLASDRPERVRALLRRQAIDSAPVRAS